MRPPQMIILGSVTFGGAGPSFSASNQIQLADQISWSHRRHSISAGFEHENVQWNLPLIFLTRGRLLIGSFPDFLIGRAGCSDPACSPANPGNTNGSPFSNILACAICARTGPSGAVHGYGLRNMSAFVHDAYTVRSGLTLNFGVRWDYNGALSDIYGNLTSVWPSELRKVPVPPSTPVASGDSLVGYVVPKNFPDFYGNLPAGVRVLNTNFSTRNGAPLSNFGPRFGFAWQPVASRLLVRGAIGLYYDRVGITKYVLGVSQGNPYAVVLDYSGPGATPYSLANPFPSTPLSFVPRYFLFAP